MKDDTLYGIAQEIDRPMPAPPEIIEMAEYVREEWHGETLEDAKIAYVLLDGDAKSKGQIVLGKAKKVSKTMRAILDADFVICLNWTRWQELNDEQRKALLDHELSHCIERVNEKGEVTGWTIRHHDVEDFAEVVKRRGLWKEDLKIFGKVCAELHQKNLFEESLKGAGSTRGRGERGDGHREGKKGTDANGQ